MPLGTVGMAALAVASALVLAGGLAACAFAVVTVRGTSMVPQYRPGDRVLVCRRWADRWMRCGDVVVCRPFHTARDEDPMWMVKRIAALGGEHVPGDTAAVVVPEGHVYVLGDAPGSVDSRRFGTLPRARIVGRVVTMLVPGEDAGVRTPPAEAPETPAG